MPEIIKEKPTTDVQILGTAYYHRFVMGDGSEQEIETTQEDYEQLGTDKAVNPILEGGTWNCSYATHKYDTPTGKLSVGEIAFDGFNYITKTESPDLMKEYPIAPLKADVIQKMQAIATELSAKIITE